MVSHVFKYFYEDTELFISSYSNCMSVYVHVPACTFMYLETQNKYLSLYVFPTMKQRGKLFVKDHYLAGNISASFVF